MVHRAISLFALLSVFIFATNTNATQIGPFEVDLGGQTIPDDPPSAECTVSIMNSAAQCTCFFISQVLQDGDHRLEFCQRVLQPDLSSLSNSCTPFSSSTPPDRNTTLQNIEALGASCLGDIDPSRIKLTFDQSSVRFLDLNLPNLSEKPIWVPILVAAIILTLPTVANAPGPSPPITFPPPTVTGGGQGDPHMTGFDGSHFDFNGLDKRFYAVFGRQHGDLLVSQMRANQVPSAAKKHATFFDSFGLQVPVGSASVHVSIAPNVLGDGSATYGVKVQGRTVEHDVAVQGVEVAFIHGWHKIQVRTVENTYTFLAQKINSWIYHIDVSIQLNRPVSASDRYLGVLGLTLNRDLGHMIREELRVSSGARRLRAMTEHFEVSGLFPERNEDESHLTGVSHQFTTRLEKMTFVSMPRAEIRSV